MHIYNIVKTNITHFNFSNFEKHVFLYENALEFFCRELYNTSIFLYTEYVKLNFNSIKTCLKLLKKHFHKLLFVYLRNSVYVCIYILTNRLCPLRWFFMQKNHKSQKIVNLILYLKVI